MSSDDLFYDYDGSRASTIFLIVGIKLVRSGKSTQFWVYSNALARVLFYFTMLLNESRASATASTIFLIVGIPRYELVVVHAVMGVL